MSSIVRIRRILVLRLYAQYLDFAPGSEGNQDALQHSECVMLRRNLCSAKTAHGDRPVVRIGERRRAAMDFYPARQQDRAPVLVGCAGWSVPGAMAAHFPQGGSHLERYATVFPGVEINTSFYRPHRPATYARWRDSVPDAFRFAVKVPKEITHGLRLHDADAALEKFLGEAAHLHPKLGCLLVQLPPSLTYDAASTHAFFHRLRGATDAALVCEPRHRTWFEPAAADALAGFGVAYVNADPQVAPLPASAGAARTVYYRLHGAPVMYYSAYTDAYLEQLAGQIEQEVAAGRQVWCIFDNTAEGAAVPNALSLLTRLRAGPPVRY